ncbi:MAG: energy-coupling factor transporter ATPase [Clostridia bacterium]|nr:energy-coupling factor transporter ATPase [Clostridia bacterium]MBR5173567.1 energy-coupling factor transporter ATPase [Clostridia bacterium]
MQAIKIEALTHIYSKKTPSEKVALDNINLSIEEGEFVAIVGHTGSGKSTLVQHLNGLIKPHKKGKNGRVEIFGRSTTEKKGLKQLRFDVGMVFQYPEYQLFEDTVAKDIAFGPKNMKLDKDEIDRRVRKSLELVGLPYDDFAERSPFELSGGEKRRVAIAGVIAMEPKILVLDEPFAGLDPEGVREITELILKLKREICPTIITVTHDMDSASTLADRVVALCGGKIVADGTPKEVFGNRALIKEIGLDVPFVARVVDRLEKEGIVIDKNVLTIEELAAELERIKTGGGANV